jgi:uncharacterized protein (DUF1684 family)
MKKLSATFLSFIICFTINAQLRNYADSTAAFRNDYISTHEVVKREDRKQLHFFPINESYRVKAKFEKVYSSSWFQMETSGKTKQTHRVYGVLHFTINDTIVTLTVYQSQTLMGIKKYADYLFVPFTDITSGETTYENGRYIDLKLEDIKNSIFLLDFNKAYNPYCAYVSGIYNCPIPPAENNSNVAIMAGEMKYSHSK